MREEGRKKEERHNPFLVLQNDTREGGYPELQRDAEFYQGGLSFLLTNISIYNTCKEKKTEVAQSSACFFVQD